MSAPNTDSPTIHAADALGISGVAMIIDQGNLDHWFNADLWGVGSSIRPSGKAFDVALRAGLVEKKHGMASYRLTSAGRYWRALRSRTNAVSKATPS